MLPITLTHGTFRAMRRYALLTLLLITLLAACRPSDATPAPTVTISADGTVRVVTITDEITVSDVLRRAGITYDDLVDRINPSLQSRVTDGLSITIVRVRHETISERQIIPFDRVSLANDSLAAGDEIRVQAGANGEAEVMIRITYEDGVEVSRTQLGPGVIITPPRNEIVMFGSQGELATVPVKGTLVFVSSGNVWIIRQNSANKRALTQDGGVDSVILDLSQDGRRLLFSRSATLADDVILSETPVPTETASPDAPFNSLWVVLDTTDRDSEPVRLDLNNILYAAWVPGSEREIVYSTAEPRSGWPGWQANNDLWTATISANGAITNAQQLLETSSGGIYGFYGTTFSFAPDGVHLAWSQADAVGVLLPDYTPDDEDELAPTVEPTPTVDPESTDEAESTAEPEPTLPAGLPPAYDRVTLASFAPANVYQFIWRPGIAWSPDGQSLITTMHGAPLGTEPAEDSPLFHITAFDVNNLFHVELLPRAGIWAKAQYSPSTESSDSTQIAFLEALNPLDSQVSQYRLAVMDRDGSNRRYVFPAAEDPGISSGDLDDKGFAWSPDGRQIAVIYEGNLYLVDVITGLPQQITQDGNAESPRWMP